MLARATAAEDAKQRWEAALALGAWGGGAARLQTLLGDADTEVVIAATIGLGLDGSAHARWALQHRLAAASEPWLRGVVMVALGLAAGGSASRDADLVAAIWSHAEPATAAAVAYGACAFDLLAPTATMATALQRCLGDAGVDPLLRGYAAAAWVRHGGSGFGDVAALGSARDAGLRRSGLSAIANCDDAAAASVLQLALAQASGPEQREWVVLQLALRREDSARTQLLQLLTGAHKPLRPVAALALGYACRGGDVPEARTAVLAGLRDESCRERLPAWYLAAGLLSIDAARPQLQAALAGELAAGRGAAAEALVLLDGAAANAALQARLQGEPEPALRVLLVELLAHCGGPLPPLLAAADAAPTAAERAALVAAIGWLRSEAAVQWLAQRAAAGGAEAAPALHGLARAARRRSLQPLAACGRDAAMAGWLRHLVRWFE